MLSGLPIRLHRGSSSQDASTRWPRATLGDLCLFQSSTSHQTDAAVIRGMERTMDVMGKMSHRAGPGPGAPSLSLRLTVGEGRVNGHPLSRSMEVYPKGRTAFSPLHSILGDKNVGICGLTASEDLEGMHELSTPPQIPHTRPFSSGGRPGSLEGQTIRHRSNTDIRRKPVPVQASSSGRSSAVSKSNPRDSGTEIFVPIEQISSLSNAEAIGRMMVAANPRTLHTSQRCTVFPEYLKGRTSRGRATYQKDLEHWLGSEVGSLPDIMDPPAFAHYVVPQKGTQSQWMIPPGPYTALDPAEMSISRKDFPPFERFINLGGISVAEESIIREKNGPASSKTGHRATKSMPSLPQDSSFQSEHASSLRMLRRRRHNANRPDFRVSEAEYPNEEELKAIQRNIRARSVKGWIKKERRDTWYKYGLGVQNGSFLISGVGTQRPASQIEGSMYVVT